MTIIVAVLFYVLYPKYYFYPEWKHFALRGNRITGEVEIFTEGKWMSSRTLYHMVTDPKANSTDSWERVKQELEAQGLLADH